MAENDPALNQPPGYVPPQVWAWDTANGGAFAAINRPVSGALQEKELPIGKHPLQLYSLGTPNGVKVTDRSTEPDQPRPGRRCGAQIDWILGA